MLTPEQKLEAEKKLKNMNEQLSIEEHLKSIIKKSSKAISQYLSGISNDPKKHLETLRNLANNVLPQKIYNFDSTSIMLQQVQDKMKNQKEKLSKETFILLDQKQKYQAGIQQIKKTILNIQKTVKESVEEEVNKRKKIQDDLEKSLDDIRSKIAQFEKESQVFDKENVQLKEKIDALKAKLGNIEQSFKTKAEEKDEEVKKEREELTEKLKILEAEVQKATELNKQYSAVEKKNFDNKLALYLKTKKFPQFSSSFESSAKTLDSCKQELLKGTTRLNIATQAIQKCQKEITQNNNLFLIELKKQKDSQSRVEQIKRQKQGVRARIIELQSKLKQKKAQIAPAPVST